MGLLAACLHLQMSKDVFFCPSLREMEFASRRTSTKELCILKKQLATLNLKACGTSPFVSLSKMT